ncbi:MAG: nicotinate-nucleotide adenylyltransferase, partial [Eudoraea sp.]|nr:nicotinate-nucleotide adenylyltransferase [Eudoraea sp.]
RKVAAYDVTTKDYYQDDYDYYTVEFYIPDGKIVAAYDTNGKILRTIEKFDDIKLPTAVSEALLARFPNWTIAKDVYRVTYTDKKGAKKVYKLKLENGEKTMKVKMNEDGEFL